MQSSVPRLRGGQKRIMYTASNGHSSCVPVVAIGTDGKSLNPPEWFVCVWNDKGTGKERDGSLWKAIPPHGWVALSDVAIYKANDFKPGDVRPAEEIDPDFRCVSACLRKRGTWATRSGRTAAQVASTMDAYMASNPHLACLCPSTKKVNCHKTFGYLRTEGVWKV